MIIRLHLDIGRINKTIDKRKEILEVAEERAHELYN